MSALIKAVADARAALGADKVPPDVRKLVEAEADKYCSILTEEFMESGIDEALLVEVFDRAADKWGI